MDGAHLSKMLRALLNLNKFFLVPGSTDVISFSLLLLALLIV